MSPHGALLARTALPKRATVDANHGTVAAYLSAQWHNPSDILSILLLLGPEVVQRAVAQLAGRVVTPVAFSFGWVAHAVYTLLSSVGDGHLMPEAEDSVLVIGAASGHVRTTSSWVLTRFLRDFNDSLDKELKDEAAHLSPHDTSGSTKPTTQESKPEKSFESLRITVFQAIKDPEVPHGTPTLDLVWYSGFAVIAIQLVLAIVAWAVYDHWDIFIITLLGTLLALASSSLLQWSKEKWSCPKKGGATVTITEGNGSRSAVTILGSFGTGSAPYGLDLEVLARGSRTAPRANRVTKIYTALSAVLWILLLVTVAGMHQETWFLFAIGILGSLQNIVAAGIARDASALGLHLEKIDTISSHVSVAHVLKEAETKYPGVGTSLVDTFFPGGMRVNSKEDKAFWISAMNARIQDNHHGIRLDRLLSLQKDSDVVNRLQPLPNSNFTPNAAPPVASIVPFDRPLPAAAVSE